jgi:hypothetical protein
MKPKYSIYCVTPELKNIVIQYLTNKGYTSKFTECYNVAAYCYVWVNGDTAEGNIDGAFCCAVGTGNSRRQLTAATEMGAILETFKDTLFKIDGAVVKFTSTTTTLGELTIDNTALQALQEALKATVNSNRNIVHVMFGDYKLTPTQISIITKHAEFNK